MGDQLSDTAVMPITLTGENTKDRLKEITDKLEAGIKELFDSEKYKSYLKTLSKFHNYSFNNTMLIAMQKPDASLVAGFESWKNNFGRAVQKGEKGIKIIAPAPFKTKQETEKIDPKTKRPIIGKDGKPLTEASEVTIPYFKVISVFDVSQTAGREIPTIGAEELTGDVEKFKDFLAALEKTSPVPLTIGDIEGEAKGYFSPADKEIVVQGGMSELQTLKTAIHEMAHAKLHDIDPNTPKEEQHRADTRSREVEAESVAYTVCQHYGLDTSDYSFGYVAGWSSGKEMTELKASLETIRLAAAELITGIDGSLSEIQKAKEAIAEKTAAEKPDMPDTAKPQQSVAELEAKAKSGEPISIADLTAAIVAEKQPKSKEAEAGKPERKKSIKDQLKDGKDQAKATPKKTKAKSKSNEMEV